MSRSSKRISREAQARKIALQMVKSRKELSKLREQLLMGKTLDAKRNNRVIELTRKINNYKASIIHMGLDPKDAAKWAKAELETHPRVKRGAIKHRRSNGIGMYGLGSSVKIWK